MNKEKIKTMVFTFVTIMVIILSYITITFILINTPNNSPIIKISKTETNYTLPEANKTKATEKKNTATSRSGKHESLQNNSESNTSEPTAQNSNTISEASTKKEKVSTETPVQKEVVVKPKPTFEGIELQYSAPYNISSAHLTKSKGVTHYNGHKETYYSQKVLSGKGLKMLNNNGRHVADDGTIRDGDGFIAIACNYLSKGSAIMTSLGPGKVYDTGSMKGKWIDIYVNW